jgi:hypothetical protein
VKEFDVYVQDKPGELARVCEILGSSGVNIKAIASERGNARSTIRIVTDDETTTASSLSRNGIKYNLRDVMTLNLADKPGELGKVARKLARSMVNVDSIYILHKDNGTTEMAMTVDKPAKARQALK